MNSLDMKNRLFGAGHRILTVIGALAGGLVALGQYLDLVPESMRTQKWYVVAAALVSLGAALKLPSKADAAKAAIVPILFFALAGPVFAQDASVPTLPKLSLDLGKGYSVQTGLAAAGTVYVKTGQGVQALRNVTFSALVELGTPLGVDPVVGPAYQTGTAQGYGASVGVTERKTGANLVALVSPFVVGKNWSWAWGLGTMLRY